ncbi:hypothetical protein [Actinoplanes ianthinogenes]|nr:hypothetical protein [Actinoplanes ianthinogenes]
MATECGLATLLRPGGPVRVPFRRCCAAALVGADAPLDACSAARVPDRRPPVCAPVAGVWKAVAVWR